MKPDKEQQIFPKKHLPSPPAPQSPPPQQSTLKQQLKQIHTKYFTSLTNPNTPPFEQIDHGPKQLCQELFSIQQNCLVISYEAFQRYYECLFKMLRKEEDIEEMLMAVDVLLAMNGQNDRAWNLKKKYLMLQAVNCLNGGSNDLKEQTELGAQKQYLNIKWQLIFNAAICLKCKKSSSYYEYRLRLIQVELNQLILNEDMDQTQMKNSLEKILERQDSLIKRVLARFFRNYFVWMYRVKLIKLIHQKIESLKDEIYDKEDQEENLDENEETLNKKIEQQSKPYNPLMQTIITQQLHNIHKFLQKYCNDYSGYSYLISFFQRYIIQRPQQNLLSKPVNQLIKEQKQWARQLNQYCELAYDSSHHYKHLLMYREHLKRLQGKFEGQQKGNQVEQVKQ